MMDSKEGEALKRLGYVKKTYYLDITQSTIEGAVRRKCAQGLAVVAFFDVHGPAIWPKNQWNERIKPEWDKSIKADLTKRYTVTQEMIKEATKRIKEKKKNKKRKKCNQKE
jgi:Mor family transcriptional regulator